MQIDHQDIASKVDLTVPQTQEMLTETINIEDLALNFSPELIDELTNYEFNIFKFSDKVGRKMQMPMLACGLL